MKIDKLIKQIKNEFSLFDIKTDIKYQADGNHINITIDYPEFGFIENIEIPEIDIDKANPKDFLLDSFVLEVRRNNDKARKQIIILYSQDSKLPDNDTGEQTENAQENKMKEIANNAVCLLVEAITQTIITIGNSIIAMLTFFSRRKY